MNKSNFSSVQMGGLVWILAVQFFMAQIVVQWAWTTPFSLLHNFISDLGNTTCGIFPIDSTTYVCSPWHAWMNASFILQGFIIFIGAMLIRPTFPSGKFRTAGFLFLFVAAVGNLLVGLFPEDVNTTYHRLGAALHFILGNLAMLVLGLGGFRGRPRSGVAASSIILGLIGLLATGLFVSGHYAGIGVGGMERVAAYPLTFWLISTGIYFLSI